MECYVRSTYTQPPCSNLPRPRASRQPPPLALFFFAGRRRTYMLAHPHSPSPRITRFCNLLTLNLTYYWIWYGSQDWSSLLSLLISTWFGFYYSFWAIFFFSYFFFFFLFTFTSPTLCSVNFILLQMWGRDQVNILWLALFSCIHLLTTPWLWHQPVFPLWLFCYLVTLFPCSLIGLLDYWIITLLFFSKSRLTKPGPKRAQKGGSTWTCVRVKLCVWPLSLSPDGVDCGLGLMEMMPWLHLLFYFILFFCIFLYFFFLSSSLSGAAGSLWFITTFLIWAYRGYSIYIIQTPCERSIFTFPSLWIKHLCPFLLDCIPIGQEPHHLLSIAWLYLHLLIERTWVTETPRFSPPTPLFALIKKKKKKK